MLLHAGHAGAAVGAQGNAGGIRQAGPLHDGTHARRRALREIGVDVVYYPYTRQTSSTMLRAHLNVYALHRRLGNWKDAEWALAQVRCRTCGHSCLARGV